MCSCIGGIIKFILYICNIIIWVAGAGMVAIGIWILVEKPFEDNGAPIDRDAVEHIDFALYDSAFYILFTIGAGLFLVGFFGCCGLCKGSSCMLNTYCLLFIILIILECVVIGLASAFNKNVDDWFDQYGLEKLQKDYTGEDAEDEFSKGLNYVQMQFECCGVNGYMDYRNSSYYQKEGQLVPYTCCVYEEDGDDPKSKAECLSDATEDGKTESEFLNTQGCQEAVASTLNDRRDVVMYYLIVVIAVELLLIILTCCTKSRIKSNTDQANKVA